MTVLVTGAEEHQGLAVIRGLGLGGVPVVACGAKRRSIGFYSRHAKMRRVYTSPFVDGRRFVDDILDIAQSTGARLIIPSVESTLVVLDAHRSEVERQCTLAAPASATLEAAVDKLRTLELADRLGVPTPKTVTGTSRAAVLDASRSLTFPVSVKPRGHALYGTTKNSLGFKVKYARTIDELEVLLATVVHNGAFPLIQEYAPGTGICVAALCDRGRAAALFPYQRVREVPLTGGVSVLRRSLPPDERLNGYVRTLLGALEWHGVAMVEFRYHAETDRYVLMEINGRFQASTALSIDAGLNLPYLVYALYTGATLDSSYPYRAGVEERWLRGDVGSLLAALAGDTRRDAVPDRERPLPSRSRLLLDFLRSFRPGMKYDEFRLIDPGPGLIECGEIGRAVFDFFRGRLGAVAKLLHLS